MDRVSDCVIYFVGDAADAFAAPVVVDDLFAFFFLCFLVVAPDLPVDVDAEAGADAVAGAVCAGGVAAVVPSASVTVENAATTSAATKCFMKSRSRC